MQAPLLRRTLTASLIGFALGIPLGAAAGRSGTYEGTVVRVFDDAIEVRGSDGNDVRFSIRGRLRNPSGAETARLERIKAADRVKVEYAQDVLGMRHADEIIDESSPTAGVSS
jgi:hypothetical protein